MDLSEDRHGTLLHCSPCQNLTRLFFLMPLEMKLSLVVLCSICRSCWFFACRFCIIEGRFNVSIIMNVSMWNVCKYFCQCFIYIYINAHSLFGKLNAKGNWKTWA
jgi:hypothetical protein